jgi:hypothetical protein
MITVLTAALLGLAVENSFVGFVAHWNGPCTTTFKRENRLLGFPKKREQDMNGFQRFAKRMTAPALAAAIVLSQGTVRGQQPSVNYYPYSTYSSSYGHASTLEEGAARGMADVVRSAGAAELMASEAAKNYEQARSMYFDNRLKFTQTYFDMKQLNQAYRQEARGQRPTSEQLFRIAHERAPQPLSPSELDPYSGEVRWPVLLLAPEYAEQRVLAESLVQEQAGDAVAVSPDQKRALKAALDGLAAQLKSNVSAYNPQEYTTAKNFLQSLAATTGVGMIY